ncbi:unnamed protein product [Didymodactylos carnosus]|uniref:catechol O-methyltransferase n=1 Tax=Didymodactylos carnosus TaxID=1234261 RepID=A0A815K1L0_9BILA|nr:unnamed protein product [Didymodactylos carnosus]CAF4284323.1 unnamed protein product [Didymodactylos carnosus]
MSVEQSLLNYVLSYSERGNIQSVLNSIDHYCWSRHMMVHIGDVKGAILDAQVRKRRPKTVLELGTYCGYGTLRIISQLPRDALFISVEADPATAYIAQQILEHAGVIDRVIIVPGLSDYVIPQIRNYYNISSFDFIFIDHSKESYLRDLRLLEHTNLISTGSMIVADNVIFPGVPDYLQYVRNNPNYKSKLYESFVEYSTDIRDGVEVSVRK